jgi:hypothetical protein
LPVVVSCGFSLAITGGILRNGSSTHDVDFMLYPLQSTDVHKPEAIAKVKQAMFDFGIKPVFDRTSVTARWRSRGSKDQKWVEVWDWNGLRIDIFFVR